MHTILGAGGPVANALTQELAQHNETIRLVSRKTIETTSPNISWKKADLLNYSEVLEATKGSTVIYLCAGLVYDKDVWKQQWPILIKNVIDVTKATGARLIFFDNVYMYGLTDGPMTEETPYKPSSLKGEIRAGIANTVMNEIEAGTIRGSIARAADFYGTHSKNSFFDMMVLDKYANKEKAQWIGSTKVKHNFSYIPDMGKAMYLLGQNPDSDNQIWHLPTAPPLTGQEFIEMAASIYNVKPSYMKINKLLLFLVGLFQKVVMGAVEMYYQYDHDYIFDSSKFEKAFNFKPTSYKDGIMEMSKSLYKR